MSSAFFPSQTLEEETWVLFLLPAVFMHFVLDTCWLENRYEWQQDYDLLASPYQGPRARSLLFASLLGPDSFTFAWPRPSFTSRSGG